MNVGKLAADNAVLFLWTTAPMLPETFRVVEAWGFEYKTNFVWDKQRHMFGNYASTQHEHLLLCTRGRCLPDRRLPLVSTVIRAKRSRRHSEKPVEARQMIERLYDGPRIELFARQRSSGWAVFGNDPAVQPAA